MAKLIIIIFVIISAIIYIPNPLQNTFPNLIQTYINYKSKNPKGVLDLNELEIAQQIPLRCSQSSNCMVIPCGKGPNCHSIAINKTFYDENKNDLPPKFSCPKLDQNEDNCGEKILLDTYVACEESECVLKQFFSKNVDN